MAELRLCWYSKLENYNTQHLLMLYRAQMNQQLKVNLKRSPLSLLVYSQPILRIRLRRRPAACRYAP